MNGMAAVIGWGFLACVLIGSCIPGWNFHVYLLTDEQLLERYKEKVAMLETRLSAKRGAK